MLFCSYCYAAQKLKNMLWINCKPLLLFPVSHTAKEGFTFFTLTNDDAYKMLFYFSFRSTT